MANRKSSTHAHARKPQQKLTDLASIPPGKRIKPCVGAVSTANLMARQISRGEMTGDLLQSLEGELRRHALRAEFGHSMSI